MISICDASAKLYHLYQVAKKRDNDIANLRLELLQLQEKSILVRVALEREGLRTEDQHKVRQALEGCEKEVKRIQDGLAKFPQRTPGKGKPPTRVKLWLRGLSQKAQWPFQRSTIVDFLEDVRTCHSAVDESLKLLQLKVGMRTIEELRALDDKVTNNLITSDTAFSDLKSCIENAFQQFSEQLARQEQELSQVSQQTKLNSNNITAEEIKRLLLDPDFQKRQSQVSESHDKTYDFFTKDVQQYPQAANLLNFLQTGTGVFWIPGEAASGKSTLMKHLSTPKRPNNRQLWVWKGDRDITIARHFCWTAGSGNEKSQSALLWTLLYYILSEERHLFHLVCDHGPGKEETYAAWRTANLWFCLFEAIRKSDKRIVLFIDGLDELEETGGSGRHTRGPRCEARRSEPADQCQDDRLVPALESIPSTRDRS